MKYLKGFFQVGILMLAVVTLSWSTATGFRSLLLTLDSSDSYALKIVDSNGSTIYNVDTSGNLTTGGAPTLSGSITMANSEVISNSTDDTVRIASDDASVNVDIYSPNATNGTAALTLIGDVGADATDRFRIVNSADGTLNIQNDTSVAGTYVTKVSFGAGTQTLVANDDSDSTITLQADKSDDNGDDWLIESDKATNSLIVSNDTSGSQVAKVTVTTAGVITSALGTVHTSEAASALTPGATPALTVSPGRQIFTYTPADNTDATFNASGGGSAGDEMIFIFTTDTGGSQDEVMTFGTNMYSTGTLTMANLTADIYVVSFISNGTAWVEKSRTIVQTT